MAKFNPNDTIGVYRIVRPLGEGGMGAVYEVEHTQLGVHYALKTFTLNEDDHVELMKNKFLAEGKVLARLHDPHIVRVFDLNFDEATRTPYFVMDLVVFEDGDPHTLADVETSDLEEEYIYQWFCELAAALDYIHAQGIVHRDIKLNNVLLNADKHVILSDFGVSRFFSQNLQRQVNAMPTMISAATNSRLVMGTQGYMAPEVERGEEVTIAADSYSLGVMFVYLLTGLWYEPSSKVFKLLEALEYRWIDILPRLLSANPSDRPTDLAALAKELNASQPVVVEDAKVSISPIRADSVQAAPAQKPRSRVGLVICAAGVILVAVGAAMFIALHHSSPSQQFDDLDEMLDVKVLYQGVKQ